MKLGEAFIALGFNVDDAALKEFSDKITDLEVNLFKVSGTAAAALYGIDKFIDSVTHNAVALRDLSIATGLSKQEFQEWAIAAHLSDTAFSTEAAEANIKSLQGHLAELHNFGTGALSFSRLLGADAKNMNAFQVLQILHDRMPYLMANANQFGGQAGIASLMQQIGLGDQWLNLLQQTDIQYKKTHEAAQAYMLKDSEIKNLTAMDFAAEQLRMRLALLAQQFGASFSPQLVSIMNRIPTEVGNIATGMQALKTPLEVVVGLLGTAAILMKPWTRFGLVLTGILWALDEIGESLNDKENKNPNMLTKAAALALGPKNIGKDQYDKIVGKDVEDANANIAKLNQEQFAKPWQNLKNWFASLDVNSDYSRDMRARNQPLGNATTNNNSATVAPTINIHVDDAKKGTDAAVDYTKQIGKANDFFGNYSQ